MSHDQENVPAETSSWSTERAATLEMVSAGETGVGGVRRSDVENMWTPSSEWKPG